MICPAELLNDDDTDEELELLEEELELLELERLELTLELLLLDAELLLLDDDEDRLEEVAVIEK